MYAYYAVYEMGLEPKILAAGDDLIVWVHHKDKNAFISRMKSLAHHDKNLQIKHGLGQIIKEYSVKDWWNIDFCSKYACHVGDKKGYHGWYLF
jgi:hypothetical protein